MVIGCGCPDVKSATILPFGDYGGDVSALDLILTEFLFQLSSRIQRLGHEGRKDMGRLESLMMMLPYMLISNFVWTQKKLVNGQFCSIIQRNRATWPRGTKGHGTSWQLDATAYRSHWREGGTGEGDKVNV